MDADPRSRPARRSSAPPVTVTAPGRDAAPDEDHAEEPAAAGRRWLAPVGVAALVLVVAAAAVRGAAQDAPTAAAVPGTAGFVTASVALATTPGDRLLVQRLTVDVRVADLGGDELVLRDVTARGFALRLSPGPTPLVLAAEPGGRVVLPAEAVVTDCALDRLAQRSVELVVQRGNHPPAVVRPTVPPDVVAALDRLVRLTCRRSSR